jgi:hypothetical protein
MECPQCWPTGIALAEDTANKCELVHTRPPDGERSPGGHLTQRKGVLRSVMTSDKLIRGRSEDAERLYNFQIIGALG